MIPIIFDNLVDGKYYLCYRTSDLRSKCLCYIFKMCTDNDHSLDMHNKKKSWLVNSKDIHGVWKLLKEESGIRVTMGSGLPAIILCENNLEYFELTEEEILNHIVAEKI